ncbi:MAG TPA: glycosyltransferase family 2 protein, partial [Candidatus Saccharimonadales bacterium]|nr:glycosyltransferase family 2 protein [Candidatus Saccharimonadales bacterium]
SHDDTAKLVKDWHRHDDRIKLLKLSRNFGKENTLSAGLAAARGQAILTIDGDGQHPAELIPQFVADWRDGAQVVVGVRSNRQGSRSSKLGSRFFYRIFNKLTGQRMLPGSTDYRLIDRAVQQAFLQLGESGRMTRALIDWLGFERTYIRFEAAPRGTGNVAYSLSKLVSLAANSFVSHSPKPLYLFGYLGVFITLASFTLGVTVFVEQLLLGDPLHWKFTGTAMLAILILFLIGIVLLSQGMLSLYVSHIHHQSKRRPLYIIDYAHSAGVKPPHED